MQQAVQHFDFLRFVVGFRFDMDILCTTCCGFDVKAWFVVANVRCTAC